MKDQSQYSLLGAQGTLSSSETSTELMAGHRVPGRPQVTTPIPGHSSLGGLVGASEALVEKAGRSEPAGQMWTAVGMELSGWG